MKTKIVDKYNSSKVWIVKRYECGNYYYNQENSGRMLNKKFTRTTKAFLVELGVNF